LVDTTGSAVNSFKNLPVWFKKIKVTNALEIGVKNGHTALWLIDKFNCAYTGIDKNPGEGSGRILDFPGTKLFTGLSGSVLRTLNDSFDLIFIDGNHSTACVLEDSVLSWPLLSVGGVMIWHDYLLQLHGNTIKSPKLAIDSFLNCMRGKYGVLS
jgi:hypothetical protein